MKISRILVYLPLAAIILTAAIFLAMFLMGGMTRISGWYLMELVLPIVGLVGIIFAVIRALVRRRIDRVSNITGLASILAILPAVMMIMPLPFPSSIKTTSPSATVRLPADVALKVGWGGDTMKVNQHVVTPDQRWAYDFLIEPYMSGSTDLTDYGCYGVPVVAPAAGLVTEAHDGEPDTVPGVISNNYEAPKGNYVVIQLDETGTYLVIAHLKPGSVLVSSGQRVEEGQEIGQCGNSGNTSEPHIHIHHQRQDPAVFPLNFAEGLPLYFRDHDGAAMPQGGIEMVDGEPVLSGDTVMHVGP